VGAAATPVQWDAGAGGWVDADASAEEIGSFDEVGVFTRPWVGFVHNPPDMPAWFDGQNAPQNLMRNERFMRSLPHCAGIFVFSSYLKRALERMIGRPCPVDVVRHPTEPTPAKWSIESFEMADPELVQIGYWLRRLTSIWEVELPDGWRRSWVNRAQHGFRLLEAEIYNEQKGLAVAARRVDVVSLDDEAYDAKLASTVAFMDAYDSSVNNAVVECIVRHAPIACRRLPATAEYLGEDYALFFDDIREVRGLLTRDSILRAHHQLARIEASGALCRYVCSITSLTISSGLSRTIGPNSARATSGGPAPSSRRASARGPSRSSCTTTGTRSRWSRPCARRFRCYHSPSS
jgi:hypothetical protein